MNRPPTLHRKSLARLLAHRHRIPEGKARVFLDSVLTLMTEHLSQGGKIQFDKFLTLEVATRSRNQRANGGLPPGNAIERKIYTYVRLRISRHLRKSLPIQLAETED